MSPSLSPRADRLEEPVAVEGFVFDNQVKEKVDHVEESGLGSEFTPDPVVEKKLVRKLDWLILPAMCLLYTGSSLDRSNIGNAKTIGLIADLGGDKTGKRYALLNAMFFVGYVNWMIVAGIVGKKTKMNVMLGVSGIVWGIAAACMGAIKTWEQGYAVRYLLGLGEAGFAPLVTVYLARWYTRRELALRVAFWLATAPIAGIVNGLLAYGVSFVKHSIQPWRLLFIIEGGTTVCSAIYCLFVFPGDPETSSKLNEEERVCMRIRKQGELSTTHINWKHARSVFYAWQFLIPAGMYQVTIMLSTALGAFLPTLVQAVGYTGALAQVYTLPPYAAGGIGMMSAAWLSDRFHIRGPFVMTGFAFLMLGFALLAGLNHTVFSGRYAALVFAEIGQYILLPLVLTWAAEQAGNESRRAVGMPYVSTLSQAMGIPAGYLFPSTQGPQYRMGAVVALCLSVWGLFLAVLYSFIINRENKRKDREEEPIDGVPDVEGLAHDAPGFRYAP